MLDNNQFYFQSIRKMVVAFGTVFNGVELVRADDDSAETKSFIVPLAYAPREHYISTLKNGLDGVQISYPRMSYEMVGLQYDPSRKLATTAYNKREVTTPSDQNFYKQLNPVPYLFSFRLSVYVRTIEDGLQIVEQIVPYFTPDFVVTVKEITNLDIKRDVPIQLDSITSEDSFEGDVISERTIVWTLDFIMKGYIYPPIRQEKPILTAIAKINSKVNKTLETVAVSVDPLTAKESEVWNAITTIT